MPTLRRKASVWGMTFSESDAGGVRSHADIVRLQALGASAVQLGTPFAVTLQSDAHAQFKRVPAQARDEERVGFTSVAGLPARAVATRRLKNYLKAEARLQRIAHVKPRCTLAFDCLAQCGLRHGLQGWGPSCIDTQLAAALRGDVKKGLFFRGVGALPLGAPVRSVGGLMQRLLRAAPLAPAQRDLAGQVLMPSSVYAGHQPISPVAIGTTPIQPHTPIVPVSVSAINTSPASTRSTRSKLPSLAFICHS